VTLEDGERLAVAVPQPRRVVEVVRIRPSGANTALTTWSVWPLRIARSRCPRPAP
jgi:hypothetical protein